MEKYRNYLQAFITKGTEIKLEMDAIKRLNKGAELWSYNVNDTKLLVEREIQERLTGPRGEGVNVTVKRSLRHIQRHVDGRLWRHKLYNGKPVFRTFHIKFSDDLALPPNWGYEVVEAWVSKRTHHLKCQLNELLEAGVITQEQFEIEMKKLPLPLSEEYQQDTCFKQLYIMYKNNISGYCTFNHFEWNSNDEMDGLKTDTYTRQLWNVSQVGDVDEANILVMKGANVSWRHPDFVFRSPMHNAAEEGHTALVQMLLEEGADPHAGDLRGLTALHLAAMRDRLDVVKLLLKVGADPNALSTDKWTPLQMASLTRSVKCIRTLILSGADKAMRNSLGVSAAEIARVNGYMSNWEKEAILCFKAFEPLPEDTRKIRQLIEDGVILDKYDNREGEMKKLLEAMGK
mmetsp:Transcript_36037/g.112648  ORF Transcript_36037/g.112648 Transcript_36037/m.112648 type:complete len:402 (-) Transcript_36037:116-1321(-)